MILTKLLQEIPHVLEQGSTDVEIRDVVNDSRRDVAGALFVCQKGTTFDSHTLAASVAARGAAAVVAEEGAEVDLPAGTTLVRVQDTRRTYALLCAAFFEYPTRRMCCIGVTGTKGKTTTTHMLRAIFEAAGDKTGLIGTNGITIGDRHISTKNTTPDPYILQQAFRQMADEGCRHVIMEVSSQGLMMDRVAGVNFAIGLFTNLSPDHIGPNEHASFEDYAAAKSLLFKMCRTGFVNADDEHCGLITAGHTCNLKTFGTQPGCDCRAINIRSERQGGFMGMVFEYSGKERYTVEVGIPGVFNVYNALGAIAVAERLGIPQEAVRKALSRIKVNGRMELVYSSEKCSVIVDYAHNGFAAENVLKMLRSYDPHRLVVVFGCGGNRDPHRRYEMGEAAGTYADLSIITADNSRDEDVRDIMKDIHIGFDPTGSDFIDIPDRREAIAYSIEHSQPGDVIAIIGKGHEDYQEEHGKRVHFLDREEAEIVLRRLGWME